MVEPVNKVMILQCVYVQPDIQENIVKVVKYCISLNSKLESHHTINRLFTSY